jgi:adenylate cyclase
MRISPPILHKFISLLAQIGARPAETEEERLHRIIQVLTVVLGGLPFQVVLFVLFSIFGAYLSAFWVLVFAAISALSLLALGLHWQSYRAFRFTQLIVPLLSPAVGMLALGGLFESGLVILWGMIAPLFALLLYTPRQAFAWLVFYLVVLVSVTVIAPLMPLQDQLPPFVPLVLAAINVTGFTFMMFWALYYFIAERNRAYQLLHNEQEKSENLLLNILPAEIAAILKDDQRTIADHYENASILFADVVNFTPLSATLTPGELVSLLNEVFSHFDTLTEKYGLEKIKTIGDCYMVASGVPRSRPDHAHAIIHLALEMRDYVASHSFGGHQLAFRIGINSGAVVAGVIGRKKFIYDLWGDAVNTASRMETYGESGGIQITEATYALIKDAFVCEPKGTITVKGKGEMHTWRVISAVDW